jgi:hypothetical protein
MTKLAHSFAGYKRSMQMSRNPLFVFVEGQTDRYFYSKIADLECQTYGMCYQIVTAEELSGLAGGKETLLKFFAYLKTKYSLNENFKGKRTVSIFSSIKILMI